jgi:transketolase
MRATFVETLIDITKKGHDVHLLTADLGFGLLDKFIEKFPDRFTNVGVSEANMIGVAAGMAIRGIRVFCYSIAPFIIFRTLDQIRSDLCSMNLPVTLVAAGGGLSYGMEGMTHYAIEDLAITRALPNMIVLVPADPIESRVLTAETVNFNSPCYLRLGGKVEPKVYKNGHLPTFGIIECLYNKGDLAIIANGTMVLRAEKAIELLKKENIFCRLYSLHTVKPIDIVGIKKIASTCKLIVTIEEHSIINGIGTAVAEVLFENSYHGKFVKLGLPDEYPKQLGSREWLRDYYKLDPKNIASTIKRLLL